MVAFNSRMEGYSRAQLLLKEGIEVIAGGFPCQDISAAGKGLGLAGERSGLWREMLRTIRLVRPAFAIVENVAMLLNRGMGTVLGGLAESRYDAEWDCISAAEVGAPHKRDRIWIFATDACCIPRRLQSFLTDSTDTSKSIKNGKIEPMADSHSERQPQSQGSKQDKRRRSGNSSNADMANPESLGTRRLSKRKKASLTRPCLNGEDVSYSASVRQSGSWQSIFWRCRKAIREGKTNKPESIGVGSQWIIEPDVGRVAYGVPVRMDRLKGLGNAVVPQIPYLIGESIMQQCEEL
jgi:DNA (cytosine-5)-methyltransferase 1